jgi:hypothetical protein
MVVVSLFAIVICAANSVHALEFAGMCDLSPVRTYFKIGSTRGRMS